MNTNSKKFFLVIATFAGLLLGGETAVRIKEGKTNPNLLAREIKQMIPYRILGWPLYRFVDSTLMIVDADGNQYSFQKNAGTFRIVVFGEFGEGKSYSFAFRELLTKQFARSTIEVINVNYDTYAFPHSLTLLAFDVLSWQPDLLIASHNFNDQEAAYFPGLLPDYSNKYGTAYFMPNYPNPFTVSNYLFQWSHLYWALQNFIAKQHTARATPSRVSMSELPELSKKIFERNLRTFIAIAQSRAIPLILATQPINNDQSSWNIFLKSQPYRNEVAYPLHEEFLAHHQVLNDIVSKQARMHGVPVVEVKEPAEIAERLGETITKLRFINP